MRGQGIDIIEIVGGIVPLEDIPGIDQDDPVGSLHSPDAVNGQVDGIQGLGQPVARIGRVEIVSMDVIGRKEGQAVLPVFETLAAGCSQQKDDSRDQVFESFHYREY